MKDYIVPFGAALIGAAGSIAGAIIATLMQQKDGQKAAAFFRQLCGAVGICTLTLLLIGGITMICISEDNARAKSEAESDQKLKSEQIEFSTSLDVLRINDRVHKMEKRDTGALGVWSYPIGEYGFISSENLTKIGEEDSSDVTIHPSDGPDQWELHCPDGTAMRVVGFIEKNTSVSALNVHPGTDAKTIVCVPKPDKIHPICISVPVTRLELLRLQPIENNLLAAEMVIK